MTCITCRNDAVYPATIVGKPPMEDCYMAKATERIFLPLLKILVPEIVDMELKLLTWNFPWKACFTTAPWFPLTRSFPDRPKK
ncbi:MAG: UbiD family decarboxylase [Deltaproteobacteria bacterium]|nr:UbiD family decarboxylase [Deltaproteobacteria bacterium]